ncbi:MAG: molecular chaperone TorD family protein [Nitrospirae bacterium]|nr:molecular chaperone TorD family protein [Nitrospirota bacterium]
MQEGLFENLSLLLKRVCPDAAVFSDKMGREIITYNNEELLVEYARLFIGPYELNAAPYGSIYLDEGRTIMADSTSRVNDFYRQMGLDMDADFSELPDHIAVELEFMYYLSFQQTEALKKGATDKALHFVRAQEEFLDRFMGTWVPVFCERIKAGTDNTYFEALADCLSLFIKSNGGSSPASDERGKVEIKAGLCSAKN